MLFRHQFSPAHQQILIDGVVDSLVSAIQHVGRALEWPVSTGPCPAPLSVGFQLVPSPAGC